MIFNYRTILAIVFLVGLFSCEKFLTGSSKKENFIEVKKDNLKCLKDIPLQIKNILSTEAGVQTNSKSIDDSFACLDLTLNEFQMRADGSQDKNIFSEDDLFQIFQTFLSESRISRESTSDILKLKVGLLGGSSKNLTKSEINQLRDFLKVLKNELHLLTPYVELFSFTKSESQQPKQRIEIAFVQLNSSLKKLLNASQLPETTYNFDDFKIMTTHLQLVDKNAEGLLDLTTVVKNILTGPEPLQSKYEFETVIDSIVEILRLYSIQVEGHVSFEIKDSYSLSGAIDYLESGFKIVENSLNFKKKHLIAANEIDNLISKLSQMGFIPHNIKSQTIIQFYKMILVRVFEKGSSGIISNFVGLNKIHLQNLKREIAIFKLYQGFINTLKFEVPKEKMKEPRAALASIQKSLASYNFKTELTKSFRLDSSEEKQVLLSANELRTEFVSERPVIYRFNKMVVAPNQDIWSQSWQDLTRALIVKVNARGLLIGWGSAAESRLIENATLTESNLVKWYDEFKGLAIELKIFDPRSVNAGARSFKEANLFAYSADGNDRMNYFETVQYLNILSSGGSQTLAEIKAGSLKAGCNIFEIDVFDQPWNDETCVLKDLKLNYKYYFNNMSYLVGFLDRISDQQFSEFYDQAMSIARASPFTKGKVETADLRNFTILLYYMESMYARFDVNANWTFSPSEIRNAYPTYKNFAVEFAKQTSAEQLSLFNLDIVKLAGYYCYSQDDLIQESFIFLLFNGRTPGPLDLNLAPCFGQRALIDFKGEVDRKTLLNTFKILKSVVGSD